jgi:hypothetical protein
MEDSRLGVAGSLRYSEYSFTLGAFLPRWFSAGDFGVLKPSNG